MKRKKNEEEEIYNRGKKYKIKKYKLPLFCFLRIFI